MMYETTNRPLTESEKASLRQLTPEPTSAFKGLEVKLIAHAFAAIIFGVFLVIIIRDLRWRPSAGAIVLLAVYLLYISIQARALIIRPLRLHRQKMVPYLQRQQALAKADRAQVQRIRSNDVVQIDHDDGSFFLFAIDPERAFWTGVVGPAKSWPNTDFEIFSIAGIDDEIGPICHGKHLTPRRVVQFSDAFAHFDFDKLPEDGVINASVDAFLETAARTANAK
jgi:hypothetical protein